jgi:hypothetical protein
MRGAVYLIALATSVDVQETRSAACAALKHGTRGVDCCSMKENAIDKHRTMERTKAYF